MYSVLNRLASYFWIQLTDASIRAAILAILVALILIFMRRRPAAQHAMWTVVAAGMLALPLLRPLIPVAHLPLAEPAAFQALNVRPYQLAASPDGAPSALSLAQARPSVFHLGWRSYAAIAYLIGVLLLAMRLILGVFLTRRAPNAACRWWPCSTTMRTSPP